MCVCVYTCIYIDLFLFIYIISYVLNTSFLIKFDTLLKELIAVDYFDNYN